MAAMIRAMTRCRTSLAMPRPPKSAVRSADPRLHLIPKSRAPRGFTLIEILVVVVILGILAMIVVPRVMEEPGRARVVRAKQDIASIVAALNIYKLDNFVYPSSEQGLEALVTKPCRRSRTRRTGRSASIACRRIRGAIRTSISIRASTATSTSSAIGADGKAGRRGRSRRHRQLGFLTASQHARRAATGRRRVESSMA